MNKTKNKQMSKIIKVVSFIIAIIGMIILMLNVVDNNYIPKSYHEGIKYINPTEVALYAIEYCGGNTFCSIDQNVNKRAAFACIKWLEKNCEKRGNCVVWENILNDPYTNISRDTIGQEKWISSYTQAAVAEAFLCYYEIVEDKKYLDLAQKAIEIILLNNKNGGFKIENVSGIWYETLSTQKRRYDLIGELKVLNMLQLLIKHVDDYNEIYKSSFNGLKELLPFFDGFYFIRDNLLARTEEIQFRLFNEFENIIDFAGIQKIYLTNSNSKYIKEIKIDRNGLFSISIPQINIFDDYDYELHFEFKNNRKKNISVQIKSVLNENEWITLRDGELFFSGLDDEKKDWIIPLRNPYLSSKTNSLIQKEYVGLIDNISKYSNELNDFYLKAKGYLYLTDNDYKYEIEKIDKKDLPIQTPMTTICSFDKNGVLMEHLAKEGMVYKEDEKRNDYIVGLPYYNLWAIYQQAMGNNSIFTLIDPSQYLDKTFWTKYDFLTPYNLHKLKSEPALRWIQEHAHNHNGFITWCYDSNNAYNDLEQDSGWVSAYGQSLMIDALMRSPEINKEMIKKAAYAFLADVEEGGLATYDKQGNIWFEEVPNKSHILNAHLLSINTLIRVNKLLCDSMIEKAINDAIISLKKYIWRYDAGYWSNYDLNPQKDILFQLDFDGKEAVLIDYINVIDPISLKATKLDIGEHSDFYDYPFISGIDWKSNRIKNGASVRELVDTPEQNTYFRFVIPKIQYNDFFSNLGYVLLIRYKDTATGSLYIKRQAINEGNVLEFVNLHNAKISCVGDNHWKEITIKIRPQDLGWYMGKEYQEFHVEQLKEIYKNTEDEFFKQYVEKWNDYLKVKNLE